MASVSSRGRSPQSPYDFNSTGGDTDESWQYADYSSGAGSIGFLPSPASGSLAGYALVDHVSGAAVESSPAALSPLFLDVDPISAASPGFSAASGSAVSFADPSDAYAAVSGPAATAAESHFMSSMQDVADGEFMTPQGFLFTEEQINEIAMMGSLSTNVPLTGIESLRQPMRLELDISFQSEVDEAPWNAANLKQADPNQFIIEEFVANSSGSSSPGSNRSNPSNPSSPEIKKEPASKSPSPMRKVRDGKVEKKRAASSSSSSDQAGKFVIVTPNSINAHAGRPNPFECFEALRTTQRGRKGPLANATKESALQVRRVGACFCCHARKVKCDKERPCKNCKKLMVQVPQVVCWQFQDFLTVLFPEFVRKHFKKEAMTKFMVENIEGFHLDGIEQPCEVELFSGARFGATLAIKAKFFTAKTADVLQHWHLQVGRNQVDLQHRGAVPIALEMDGSSAQRDELRKKTKEYIQRIVSEPGYADQVTDSFRHTDLPKKVISIVQKYALQSQSPIVKKALSIYAMHYVMTRHLCLTRQTIVNLQPTKMVPQNTPWVTPRVLNRQIKAVIDELMMRDMQHLFDHFSKSLKPKSRREWAPCLAAFLVLCLFMESVEAAADHFVISQNEISMRNRFQPEYKRSYALEVCQELENLPFKQFAYQFHQIYLTHSKDATSKSFNPLLDDSFLEQNELDGPAVEMVMMLRELIEGPNWSELDFLTMDPILPNEEKHPYPRDVTLNYTGRLVAKFLLSFTDEKYIFEVKD